MSTFDHPPLYTKIAMLHSHLLSERHYAAAVSLGILAYNLAKSVNDQTLEELAHAWMSTGLDLWKGSDLDQGDKQITGEPACSFCGRRQPEVRLAAGAKAFICDSCAETLATAFRKG